MPSSDGEFSINVQARGITLVGALPAQGESLYLAISALEGSQPASSISIDSRSTAEALVMLTPGLLTRDPATAARVMRIIRDDDEVAKLAQFIERAYAVGSNILDDPKLIDLLKNAVNSIASQLPRNPIPLQELSLQSQAPQFIKLAINQAERVEIDLDRTSLGLRTIGNIVELSYENKDGVGVDWYTTLEELDSKEITIQFIKNASNRTIFPAPKRLLTTTFVPAKAYSRYLDVFNAIADFLVAELNIFPDKNMRISGDKAGVYILRAYSGGGWFSRDPGERDFVKSNIPRGSENLKTALLLNIMMAGLDMIEAIISLKIFDKAEKIEVLRTVYNGCVQSFGQVEKPESLRSVLKECIAAVITKIAEKILEASPESFFKKLGKLFKRVGRFLVKLVDIAGKISSAGSAFERIDTLIRRATPLESAIIVVGDPWESGKPTANLTFSPSNPKIDETIQFTDQSSDPDNDIQSWFWDFGDGATSSSRNPTHAYSHSGSFTVTLTVRDKAGNIATVQKTINVQEKPQLKPFVYIVKTIRSDSDNVIDLTSSNPNDGSRDVIFRVTITNDGDADARVRVVDDMAGGAYRCADPGAPCEKDNLLVQARSSFSYEYRARYVGSETRDGAAVVNTARIVWIDGYYDESRRIDLGGHGTLRSSVTAYLRNPPKARPEIISIEFPSEISADGNEYNGTVRFRDQDGDVAWIQFDVVLGNWKPNGWDPQVFGLTNGTIGFTNRCYVPETVRLKVTLRDRAGNESAPFNFTFRCVNPVGPPVITRIDFPREIFANSQPVEGRVYFTSPNSNVNRAKFEVLVGTWNSLDFNPAQSLVSGTLQGGIFTFTVQCNSPEDGRFRVTLYNEAGLASRSEEFSFTCSPIYRNEICGNGIDDDGDGYIDEGCSTISILLEDTGNVKDDVFRLFIDGVEIPPDTPVGGRRYYSIDGLSRGRHTVEVFVVRDTDPPGTFTLTLSGGAVFEDGGTQHDCTRSSLDCPKRGESRTFTIIVP
jgi:PKD repeat protein